MNKTLVLFSTIILATTVSVQASMLTLDVRTEQKVKCERNLRYDAAAREKRERRIRQQQYQWVARQQRRYAQQVQQQALARNANNDEELCSGSCGCLGRDKRRDCLASGFAFPVVGYVLKFFGLW